MRGLLRNHRRDRVFEDQLLLIVGLQHQRVFVETLDSPLEFHAAHQVNGDDDLILAGVVQKAILDILRWLIHASSPNPFGKVKQLPQTALVLYPDSPSWCLGSGHGGAPSVVSRLIPDSFPEWRETGH